MTRRRPTYHAVSAAVGPNRTSTASSAALEIGAARQNPAATPVTFPCSHAPSRAKRLSPTTVYPPRRAITPLLPPSAFSARHSGYTALC